MRLRVCVFVFECESRRANFLLYRIKDIMYYCVLMLFLSHERKKGERHAGRILVPPLLAFYLFYFICCLLLCLLFVGVYLPVVTFYYGTQRKKNNFSLCVRGRACSVCMDMDISFRSYKKYALTI